MSEWQPIETAPKDGREVLIWNGSCYEVALYSEVPAPSLWVDDRQSHWIDDDGQPTFATHWMPLPAPPEEGT